MWHMVLTIAKNNQHYARITLARECDVATEQAQDFEIRFPASEGFELKLYRWHDYGEPVDFSKKSSEVDR